MAGERWRLGHRPALDGLRGVAVLLVVASHMWTSHEAVGAVGVTMFFTLSGFLITALLLEERGARGRVSLRGFYARRARRLAPALLVFLAAAAMAGAWISSAYATPGEVLRAVLYVANWGPAAGHSGGGLGHTWSLSVEEQFYLTFPLVAVLALRRSASWLLWATVGGAAVSLSVRLVLWFAGAEAHRVYYGTDTSAFALLVGCSLAIGLHLGVVPTIRRGTAVVALAGAVALGLIAGGDLVRWVGVPVAALVTAVVLRAVAADGLLFLASRPLRWVGRRSYGIYLWHFPLIGVTVWEAHPPTAVRWVLLGLTFVIPALSWRYVEAPFLRHHVDEVHRSAGRIAAPNHEANGAVGERKRTPEGKPLRPVDAPVGAHVV